MSWSNPAGPGRVERVVEQRRDAVGQQLLRPAETQRAAGGENQARDLVPRHRRILVVRPAPVQRPRRGDYDRPVAPGDVQSAFAQAAGEDGIPLERGSFDWLCEQGHVGLERVAKARRDPALVAPVIAAIAVLAAIYARLRGDRLGAPRVAREPPAARRPRARADGNRDPGRRAGALHLVPAHRARAVSRRRRAGIRPRGAQASSAASGARERRPRRAACRRRASASAACSASGPTTMRCSTSRPRRWATRRSCGSRRSTATAPPRTARQRAALLRAQLRR